MIRPDLVEVDILIDKGADFDLVVEVEDIDLTGASAQMTGRASWDAVTTVFDISTASGAITIVGTATLSTITCRLSNSVTAALVAPQDGVWNLRYTTAGGDKKHPVRGRFYVQPRATT
jgi:hypothetical protein